MSARQDLQHHRRPDLRHRRGDALGVGDGERLGQRHAERAEEIGGAALVEAVDAAGLERVERLTRRLGECRHGLRRGPQQADRHGLGAGLGMTEGRHAGRRQQRQRLLGRRRQRHGEGLCRPGELQQRLDGELGVELRRGADDEDRGIVGVVGQQPLDGAGHDLGLGAGQGEIDQLALARRDAERLQPIDQRLRRIGDVEAGHRHVVDHHGGTAAGRGGDGDALACSPAGDRPAAPARRPAIRTSTRGRCRGGGRRRRRWRRSRRWRRCATWRAPGRCRSGRACRRSRACPRHGRAAPPAPAARRRAASP